MNPHINWADSSQIKRAKHWGLLLLYVSIYLAIYGPLNPSFTQPLGIVLLAIAAYLYGRARYAISRSLNRTVLLTVLVSFGALLVSGIGGGIVTFKIYDYTSRDRLTKDVARIRLPQGCTETRREYQHADLDAVPTLFVDYTCTTLADTAAKAMLQSLSESGAAAGRFGSYSFKRPDGSTGYAKYSVTGAVVSLRVSNIE